MNPGFDHTETSNDAGKFVHWPVGLVDGMRANQDNGSVFVTIEQLNRANDPLPVSDHMRAPG